MPAGNFYRDRLDQIVAGEFAPASAYQVVAYRAGGQVKGNQGPATVINLAVGHNIPAAGGVKIFVMRRTGGAWAKVAASVRSVSSATVSTMTVGASITVLDGDYIVNIGSDTAASGGEPLFNGSTAVIYGTADTTGLQVSQSTVTPNFQGEFQFFSMDSPLWLMVIAGTTAVELKATLGSREPVAAEMSGGFGVFLHPRAQNDQFPSVFPTTQNWGYGLSFNKIATVAGSNAVHFFRGNQLTWAIGEDYAPSSGPGIPSYFAILSNKGDGSNGTSWRSTDIFAIAWGGAELDIGAVNPRVPGQSGVDGPKFRFNSNWNPTGNVDTYSNPYQYEFYLPTLQASGNGIYAALFDSARVGGSALNIDSGGVQINVSGARPALTLINQSSSGLKRGAFVIAGKGGNTGYKWGCDIPGVDNQNWSIFDIASAVYPFYIQADGRIGMGTTTPSNWLTVEHSDVASVTEILANNPSDGAGTLAAVAAGAGGGYLTCFMVGPTYTADATLAGDGYIVTQGTGKMLHIGTANVKRMTFLDTATMVGIGVDPPTTTLDVNGSLRLRAFSVNVTGNDSIATAGRSVISLSNTSGTNTITLVAPSSVDGQLLMLHIAAISAGSISLADSGNCNLAGAWTTPGAGDTLTLVAVASQWIELCRSNN